MSPKAVDTQNFITLKLIKKIRTLKIGFTINKIAQHDTTLYIYRLYRVIISSLRNALNSSCPIYFPTK